MKKQTRALYHLIAKNVKDRSHWSCTDFRSLTDAEIYLVLNTYGIAINSESFIGIAAPFETPEFLTEAVVKNIEDKEKKEHIYLLIFELWRRYLPNKASLSIFCDELDYQIESYEKEEIQAEFQMPQMVKELENLLDHLAYSGEKLEQIFPFISEFCYHDLELFLYDYTTDQICAGQFLYASDLYDAFEPYLPSSLFFDFIRVQIIAKSAPKELNALLKEFITELKTSTDLVLLFDVAEFLVHSGGERFFLIVAEQLRTLVKDPEDIEDLLALTADYFSRLDLSEKEKTAEGLRLRFDTEVFKKLLNPLSSESELG